jgi:RNA-directed DNA polymerase
VVRSERVVKPRLRGEAYLVRYIDDLVLCFQHRPDALRVQEVLRKRLGKFGLTLAETKTKLVEFGRLAQRYASKRGRRRPETIYFLGFTLYCTRNQKRNFRVGLRTEKTRLRRALMRLQDQIRRVRHLPIREQADQLIKCFAVTMGITTLPGTSGHCSRGRCPVALLCF